MTKRGEIRRARRKERKEWRANGREGSRSDMRERAKEKGIDAHNRKKGKTAPKQQFLGGSKEEQARVQAEQTAAIDKQSARVDEGLGQLQQERERAGLQNRNDAAFARSQGDTQRGDGIRYGGDSDASLIDYRNTRTGVLDNAARIEALGANAVSSFQSSADRAEQASAERTQRQAFGLAAGRGAGALRSAMAGSTQANAQSALDQSVVRAQEMNQLLGLQTDAYGQAAGIRAGVGTQDQQAAALQAQRQQSAAAAAQGYDAQQQAIMARDQALGAGVAGTVVDTGLNSQNQYMSARTTENAAQLGANIDYEKNRSAYAAANTGAKRGKAYFSTAIDPGGILLKSDPETVI